MIDEQQIREILHRRAEAISATPTEVGPALGRARRRLALTVAGTVLAVGVLVAVSLVGASRLTSAPSPRPATPPIARYHTNGKIAFVGRDGLSFFDPKDSVTAPAISLGPTTPLSECEQGCGFDDYSWSPDGRNLAFIYGRHCGGCIGSSFDLSVYVMDADGSDVRRLSRCSPLGDSACAVTSGGSGLTWSPDRSQVAFAAGGSIYAVNVETASLRRVSPPEATGAGDPAWSPDGSRIAFVRSGDRVDVPRSEAGLYVVGQDGRGVRRISALSLASSPVWSPDATRILVDGPDGIYAVGADGSNLERLVIGGRVEGPGSPSWSPNGTRIVYSNTPRARGGFVAEVWAMNADGTEKTRLYRSDCCVGEFSPPVWSPDGRKIAFSVAPAGLTPPNIGLYIMNADGSDLHRVATYVSGPVKWQPLP